ncbi:hypothetical protein RclHR1_09080003 [Rhizophagus clarus]|uniref:Uncharacterized protein n=1 Tax=Rhizophagus clarus TaxID=94130 RepID=A0A2Z6SGS4_9GLOM|nr:hypothetical protein RclHR1_09080003 [Rhizophagus clarus]
MKKRIVVKNAFEAWHSFKYSSFPTTGLERAPYYWISLYHTSQKRKQLSREGEVEIFGFYRTLLIEGAEQELIHILK